MLTESQKELIRSNSENIYNLHTISQDKEQLVVAPSSELQLFQKVAIIKSWN